MNEARIIELTEAWDEREEAESAFRDVIAENEARLRVAATRRDAALAKFAEVSGAGRNASDVVVFAEFGRKMGAALRERKPRKEPEASPVDVVDVLLLSEEK